MLSCFSTSTFIDEFISFISSPPYSLIELHNRELTEVMSTSTSAVGGFGGGTTLKRVSAAIGGSSYPSSSPSREYVTLYNDPPDEAVSLDDFECLAVERLRVLAAVETAMSRGVRGPELSAKIDTLIQDTHLHLSSQTIENNLRDDNISHWVLRLAFSSNEDLRRRFLTFECLLFKHRFEKLSRANVQHFMDENHLGYRPISGAEKDKWGPELEAIYTVQSRFASMAGGGLSKGIIPPIRSATGMNWYKVSFKEVLPLVAKRKVFIQHGFAYVPQGDLISILSSRFRTNLSQQLATAYRSLPFVKQDERIAPVIGKLQHAYLGPEFGQKHSSGAVGAVNPDIIDQIASRSFPLCMRTLHQGLKQNHHLKYHGRVQFRLFLKGIGLSMDDCLLYFQREFGKKGVSPGEFQKRYAYNIRHAYGQEGKRANYTPHNCMRIIMQNPPGPDENHGCPFKVFDVQGLRRALSKDKSLTSVQIDYIIESKKKNDFQIACRRHFEVTHKDGNSDAVGEHPNAWYEESVKYWNEHVGSTASVKEKSKSTTSSISRSTLANTTASNAKRIATQDLRTGAQAAATVVVQPPTDNALHGNNTTSDVSKEDKENLAKDTSIFEPMDTTS